MSRSVLLLFLALAVPMHAYGTEAPPAADDPVIEARLHRLSTELRCLVCQNETLAESRADLANDLRREIREMMKTGRSDEEIKTYLVSRYGDFVLYRPPVKSTTLVLWAGPFALLAIGAAAWLVLLRRRQRRVQDQPLSAEEQRMSEALLDADHGRNQS